MIQIGGQKCQRKLKLKILEKTNMAIEGMGASHDIDFNEKASCVVRNLALAYESLEDKQE